MAPQQNTDHIQTTHIGSLPRPHQLLDILKAKYGGQPYDEGELNSIVRQTVADCVRKQVECGIEIVTDGEYSKPGFFTYIRERFDGFESRPNQKLILFQQEVSAFPEYYGQYFKEAMMGGAILPIVPVVCIGPVKYRGEAMLQTDIANVKTAAQAAGVPNDHVFLPATAPSGVGINEYYKSDEEYFHALAAELNKEYRAIVTAGTCRTSLWSQGLTKNRRSDGRRFMSRRRMQPSAAFRPSGFAFIHAMASTRDPASMNRACPRSSSMCSKSMRARTASRPRIRDTNTNTIFSSS